LTRGHVSAFVYISEWLPTVDVIVM